MDEIISAAEANRSFSCLLRGVRAGRRYVVTAHGHPVARLVPIDETAETEDRLREKARGELFQRLETQSATDVGRWSRDELYER